jgi:hypothetical protein
MPADVLFETPGLSERLLQVKRELGHEGSWSLVHRYQFGHALQQAYDDETGGGRNRYGGKVMAAIATVVQMNVGALNLHKQFAGYRGCWHELSPCFLQG